METVLTKATGFLVIILIGYIMKKRGVFSKHDGQFLSKLIMQITLPAAVIAGFQGFEIDLNMVFIIFFGLGSNIIMLIVGYYAGRDKVAEVKAFYMLNTSTYNIGAFTVPFAQAFFTPVELGIVCLFDVGNAIMSLGLTFTAAHWITHRDEKVKILGVLKQLFSSIPLDVYLIMFLLSLFQVKLPQPIVTISSMIGNANGVIAMLMIGILFEINFSENAVRTMIKILFLRYGGAIVFALITWFLPLPEMMRKILMFVYFSPILSIGPILCAKCGCSESEAAVLNSLTIPISMVCMVGILLLFLI